MDVRRFQHLYGAEPVAYLHRGAGSYTVALTATNAYGNNTNTKNNYITVAAASPTFVAAGAVASGTGTISPALPQRYRHQ